MDKRSKEELLARRTEIKDRVAELDAQYQGAFIPPQSEDGKEWNALNSEFDELNKTIEQVEARAERLLQMADVPEATAEGAHFNVPAPGATRGKDIYDLSTIRGSVTDMSGMRAELHDRAKRAIEVSYFPHEKADQAECQAAVSRILATVDDEHGSVGRRIVATGSPQYAKAFGKALMGKPLNATEFSAMQLGTDTAGGYAVPFQLDPTLVPTTNLSVNPYRSIARIVQIAGVKEWDAVTAGGVTAHRVAENTEAGDDSPTLGQPTYRTSRVQVFVPFSIELEMDWGGMQTELARLIQDAKDDEEATSFTTGNGTAPNPQGIVTGATTTVSTGATATFASTDLDAVENALGTRFRSRAQWIGSRAIYNKIRHFADDAGPDLWVRIADPLNKGGNIGHTLLGYQANEASAMDSTVVSNKNILILGDFNYFVIVDRIGLSMELVPHLFGSSNRYPTGQRGFYCYWRNTSGVLSANAFRTLKVL